MLRLIVVTLSSLFLLCSSDDTFKQGLRDLDIEPQVLTNLLYYEGRSRIAVFSHTNNYNFELNQRKYFLMPIAKLFPESATCQTNIFTGSTSLQFQLMMWNEDLISALLVQLREETNNPQLQSYQLSSLPLKQVRLVWANSAQQLSDTFRLNSQWKSYINQNKNIDFEIIVSSKDLCMEAVEQLKKNPEILRSLELQYTLHETRTWRKWISVTGDHLARSDIYREIHNKIDSDGNVYVNGDDMQQLSQQILHIALASGLAATEYIDTGDAVSLVKLIFDSLFSFKQTTAGMSEESWKWTYWQDEITRPDQLVLFLNKVITKDNDTIHLIKEEFDGYSASKVDISRLFNEKQNVTEDKLLKWLIENKLAVEWTEDIFKIKQMALYQLDTGQLDYKQTIATAYAQIHEMQYTYNIPVAIPGSDSQTLFSAESLNQRIDMMESAIRKETGERTATQAKQSKIINNINEKIESVFLLSNANKAKVDPLQRLRGRSLCTYFFRSDASTYRCSANYEIAFCACPEGNYVTMVKGPLCECSGKRWLSGVCCLVVD